MAVKTIIIFSIICILICNINYVSSNKLNTLKVLLPIFNDFQTNFTLEADDGCYRWSTSRLDIIQITPIDHNENLDCSNKAVVACITKERVRNNALIIAENVHTGQFLRCDVLVDVIHSLTTITRTREILLEEDPVKIQVRAYDNLGNEFSSLFGVEFNWRVLSMGPSKDLTVLNFVKFDDSPYESPPGIFELEAENKRGNVILVEGLKTGSSKISVSLPQEECSSVTADEVQFSVIANLILMPADVYIMMGDVISFKIYYLSYGKMEEIVLPNKQYYLKTESTSIALADQYSSEVTGMALGITSVILYDRNAIDADPSTRMPSATVHVVESAYIRLSVLPYRNWAIFISDHHDIIAEVYTNTNHKITIGSGVELRTQVSDPFHVHERSANGSWLTGWGVEAGVSTVQGTLEAIVHPKYGRFVIDPPLTAQNDLTVYAPIAVAPREVILPWDPVHRPKYEVELVASGGDGKYMWTSSNHTIGVVAQTGLVRTHSYGYFEVTASMPRNHHNRKCARFWILPPIRLEIVEFLQEAEVGSIIYLHVALYAERPGRDNQPPSQIPFTQCQELPFQVSVSNSQFQHKRLLSIGPVGISCANMAIIGQQVGTSRVSVSYTLDGHTYEDSVSVSAYKPLILVRPKEEIVLAVGSSIHLIFTGGPRPSATRPHDYNRQVTVDSERKVAAEDVTDQHTIEGEEEEYTIVKVLCSELGETNVTLSIGNKAFIPTCKSQDTTAKVQIICGKPRTVALQPRIKVADVESCPMDLSADRVVVQSNQDVELDVLVRDDCGRTFLNITSFLIDWEVKSKETGVHSHKNGIYPRLEYLGTVPYGTTSYQIITPKAETGVIVVTPTLVGYRKDILSASDVTAESPPYMDKDDFGSSLPPIKTTISLYLVDDTVVTPDKVTLYNHPQNKKYLSVKQGSGFYELGLSATGVAEVEYQKSSRQMVITPKTDGELRISLIDLCLVSRPATIIINVVSVSIIRVEMSDKVELSKCVTCIVRLYDETDNLLNIPDMDMVKLKPQLLDNLASVTPDKQMPTELSPMGEIHYIVRGIKLGDTKLMFSITSPEPEVSSAPIDLQVFPPLKLFPRNGTLIIGSVLQYSSKGGPQPDSEIEYYVGDKKTAEVQRDGVVKGLKLGSTTVYARAVGINPTTGLKVIYTEDNVDLHVIALSGIRITTPLKRFQASTSVPMWATGSPDQLSPMIIGTREPPIKFEWAVEDCNIANIIGLFEPPGVLYEPVDMLSIRLFGVSPGRTKIHLNATVPGEIAGFPKQESVIFTTNLDVEIFEGLELISPKSVSGKSILMAPNSKLQLLTNKDDESSLKYSLMDDSLATPTDIRSFGGGSVVSVSETGILTSRANTGYAMILISATDDFGLKQTLSAVVEIKPIHYLLMRVNAKWTVQPSGSVIHVPLGTEFDLRASYHDDTGVRFTAGSIDLKVRTSRCDLLRVKMGGDNSSISVSARKPGVTVVKIWADGTRKTADYVKIHVEQVIQPDVATVTSGDIICFHTPLTSQLRLPAPANWSSTEPHILTILEPQLGLVQANGGIRTAGHVAVTHPLHPAAPLQLVVRPIAAIRILPGVEQRLLVSGGGERVFEVPLVLLGDVRDGEEGNLRMGWNCQKELATISLVHMPFTCHLEFTNEGQNLDYKTYFSLDGDFNAETGQYSCNILPNVNTTPDASILTTNITIWAVSDMKDVVSNRVQVKYVPALHFDKEVELEDNTYAVKVVVSGLDYILDQVTLTAVDDKIVNVVEVSRSTSNQMVAEVELLDYHWKMNEAPDQLSIELESRLTGQSEKIRIIVKSGTETLDHPRCPKDNRTPFSILFANYSQVLVILISMAIIFGATYYIYLQCMQPVLHVDLQRNRTMPGGPQAVSPFLGRNCAAALNQTRISSPTANTSFNQSAPVYGDPNSFYNTSPELRRNRRYI